MARLLLARLLLVSSALVSSALRLPPPAERLGRRSLLSTAAVAALSLQPGAANALLTCPSGVNNCWSTAGPGKNTVPKWVYPKGMSKADAAASLKKALGSYPQAGQAGVDLGGWTFAEDTLSEKGYARLEFKSGIGNFAKFFNGNKPFVDDFEVSVEDGFVCLRSSSRIGDSDFGVNAKRVNFIAAALRADGWDAPGVAL